MVKKLILMIFIFLFLSPLHAGVRGQLRQGGKLYNHQKYGSALNTYNQILRQNPTNQHALFNAGNAYYRLHEYTQAQEAYSQAAQQTGDYGQSALYNLGNAYYRAGNKQKAIESYQAAIIKNPQDKEAIHNLQLIIQEQQSKNDNQNQDNNQSDQSNNQDPQNQDQNKGQAPQEPQPQQKQDEPGQLSQQDADRVMSMAKEKEYNRGASSQAPQQMVDKDW